MSRLSETQLSDYLLENQARLYRLAYSYLHNRDDALDAVQTAACKAVEKRSALKSAEALSTWVFRILVNTCTDMLRRRGRIIYLPTEELDTGSYEDPPPDDGSLADRVNALPTEVATVIRLRFFEELSLNEISAVTESNLNTVKSRLYSGLKRLRVMMEGEEA